MVSREGKPEAVTEFDLLTPIQVAREFDRSRESVKYWVRTGKLRSIKTTDGRNVFTRREVEEFRKNYKPYARRQAS